MTNQEIIAKINAQAYEPELPKFRDILPTKGCEERLNAYKQAMAEGSQQFEADVLSMLDADYALTEKQRNTVFSAAYERGHAAGFMEVLQYADEYATFAADILEGQKN